MWEEGNKTGLSVWKRAFEELSWVHSLPDRGRAAAEGTGFEIRLVRSGIRVAFGNREVMREERSSLNKE